MRYLTFDGIRYMMRDQRPKAEILKMYAAFVRKYGPTPIAEFLNRGRVYKRECK